MNQTSRFVLGVMTLGVLASGGAEPPEAQQHDATPHGTPAGWKFRWPAGDARHGRDVFLRLECYSCHEVKGERFLAPTERGNIGPELSQMGPMHEAEYFAEAIINPSATIEKGKAYEAADGSSKMPSFNDVMSVRELVDLVAFLRGLNRPGRPRRATGARPAPPAAITSPEHAPATAADASSPRDRVAADG